uniref:UPAR/Ly6 domain-containing protein n=1 Tax=Monopterus albus TaxID=43700 RepID=A0A3Q3J4R0_MONAL
MIQLLHVVVLWFYLLPSLTCDNLVCFFSPIVEKEKMFQLTVTECSPDKLCFMADARYGNYSALSARGCMAKGDCSQVHSVHFKGTVYTMSYTCCDWPYCNSCLGITASSSLLFLLMVSIIICLLAYWLGAVERSSP